jgi:hypothetical protein
MSVQKLIACLCYIVCVLPTLNKTYLFIYLFIYYLLKKKLWGRIYKIFWSAGIFVVPYLPVSIAKECAPFLNFVSMRLKSLDILSFK